MAQLKNKTHQDWPQGTSTVSGLYISAVIDNESKKKFLQSHNVNKYACIMNISKHGRAKKLV